MPARTQIHQIYKMCFWVCVHRFSRGICMRQFGVFVCARVILRFFILLYTQKCLHMCEMYIYSIHTYSILFYEEEKYYTFDTIHLFTPFAFIYVLFVCTYSKMLALRAIYC